MEAIFKRTTLMLILLVVGCILASSVSRVGALSHSIYPISVEQALTLFDHATHSGNFLQAQRALQWIDTNYVEVLRSPHLGKLSSECLMQVLSQPAYIDEIEVFRAVRRIVEDPDSRHSSKASMLFSTVRLASIDTQKLKNEVIPSGVWPQHLIIDALLTAASDSIPKEYTRRSLGNASIVPVFTGNLIAAEFGAKIVTDKALYRISPECNGRNPLIPSVRNTTYHEPGCFIESDPAYFTTVHLGGDFLIHSIWIYASSERRCPNLQLEVSLDNSVFTPVGSIVNAFAGDLISFEPCLAAYIRYRSDKCKDRNGREVTGLRVNSLVAQLIAMNPQ